jgi:Tol biopolymer transport system component
MINDVLDWIEWSPNSDKIVCKERSHEGFIIIDLETLENGLAVQNYYEFPGFSHQGNVRSYCERPTWSPNEKYIAFIRVTEDWEQVLESVLYLMDRETKQVIPIAEVENGLAKLRWVSNNNILIDGLTNVSIR